MFLLYRVLFCNFANSGQFCTTFLGLISCKCCNTVFFLEKKTTTTTTTSEMKTLFLIYKKSMKNL